MDHGSIVVFLFTSCWLYIAALLIMSDWRWNAGRIILSLLCAAAGAWLALTDRTGGPWMAGLSALFALTVAVPALVHRRAHACLLKGRLRAARVWRALVVPLHWTGTHGAWEVIERLSMLVETEVAPPAARPRYYQALVAILAAGSRRSFLRAHIDALLSLQRYAEAKDLAERRLSRGTVTADSALAYTLAIPCAELGDLHGAIQWVRRAEDMHETPAPLDLRRFLAYMRVFAYGGRADVVAQLFARHAALVALLPPAYPHLWLGTALSCAGEHDAAGRAFELARARLRPEDELLRRAIERQAAGLGGGPPARAIPAGVEHALDALYRSARDAPPPALSAEGAWRPLVTWAFMGAGVGVWLLTEAVGGSTDPHTLLRFGANVPELVRHGQWWRMVSSIFLHIGLLHLLFNTYACYIFGRFVERTTGRGGMFTTFLVSGVAGSAASAFLGNHVVSAGASGAVFGLLGAAIVIVLRLRGVFSRHARRVYAFNFIFIAALNMVYGLMEPQIDNLAHAGGFAAGLVCGLVLMSGAGTAVQRPSWRLAGFLCAALLISAGAGMAYNVYTGGYPRRPVPFKKHIGPRGAWRLGVPVFWSVESVEGYEAVFQDHFGMVLAVRSRPRVQLNMDREGPARSRFVKAGRRDYLETIVSGGEGERGIVRASYQSLAGRPHYTLVFECRTADIQKYRPLTYRVLAEFESPGGAPARPPT